MQNQFTAPLSSGITISWIDCPDNIALQGTGGQEFEAIIEGLVIHRKDGNHHWVLASSHMHGRSDCTKHKIVEWHYAFCFKNLGG